jgi:ribose-phosphate pyrophosphokinase
MPDYEFFAFDPATDALAPQPFEVFAYPMGDLTVRSLGTDIHPGAQVLWVHTAAPDWTVVFNWATLVQTFDRRILVLPYLPSARGDKDSPSPARTNATLAAASGVTDIVTIDPHSPIWLDSLQAANPSVARWSLDLADVVGAALGGNDYLGVIGPDAGSTERASGVASALGVPVFIAAKQRDHATGRITGYAAPDGLHDRRGRYLVVDDICDGGGTFVLLADSVGPDIELDLWVTHGGFTKGPDELLARYRNVHTTDSLQSAVRAHAASDHLRIHPLLTAVTTAIRHIAESESEQR